VRSRTPDGKTCRIRVTVIGRASLKVPLHLSPVLDDGVLLLAESLACVCVLLNCAGPFAKTTESLMRACIEAGVHDLDITAEINVYRLAESPGTHASRAGVMLLPGVGWDVVSTDCLALQLSRRVAQLISLRIALQVAGSMSRGSAISAGEIVGAGLMARVDVPPEKCR